MKKVFFAAAFMMGLGTTAMMATPTQNDVQTVMQVNDFTPIELKDLPQAVQDSLKKNFEKVTLKAAAVETAEDGTKTYKVTMVDEQGIEGDVFFTEKGEIIE